MSTFIKSAAMTLLSKTLQTLLYKYLSDVDVEGVNLPSLYNSDGHSGWGVRLSNVKLREGAKLMDLPGKRRKRKKSSKKKEPKGRVSKTKSFVEGAENETKSQQAEGLQTPKRQCAEPDGLPPTSMRKHSEDVVSVDDTKTTNSLSESETIASTAPQVQSSSSWFSWYPRSSKKAVDPPVIQEDEDLSEEEEEPTSDKAKQQEEDDEGADEIDPLMGFLPDDGAKVNGGVDAKGLDEDEDDCSEEEDEDEQDEDDLPMILRLGKSGTIGILDVRLVGKDIHVYVEDAVLTIEVVRLVPDADEQKDGKETGPETKRPSVKPDPKTVGERVLAENGLARALSALPNLFLRDIVVRFVVRDKIVSSHLSDESVYVTDDVEEDLGPDDSMVEFTIELLSVTDGDDFLANFRGTVDGDDENGADPEQAPDLQQLGLENDDENDYLVKRIRTGRGPEGGITVRVHPPQTRLFETNYLRTRPLWSRDSWDSSTKHCLVRCSGLDVTGRVFLGSKQAGSWYQDDDYDDFLDVDAMLFGGVDYIAPGPQPPPLPPISSQDADLMDQEKFWIHDGATIYQMDDNGIQFSAVRSSFHRVARGLMPCTCDSEHLPCEDCSHCWEGLPGMARKHKLDAATPMPGFVLSILTRDTLEINIDRPSLEAVGDIIQLFQKEEKKIAAPLEESGMESSSHFEESERSFADYSEHSNLSYFSSTPRREEVKGPSIPQPESDEETEEDPGDISASFPAYMQPEKLQILGAQLADVVFRVHVMRDDGCSESGLSFCYWDSHLKCVTIDHQSLRYKPRSFQDVRLDIGHFTTNEYKGSSKKQIISLGLRQRRINFDEMTIETLRTKEEMSSRSPWPSTAAALLDVQPPLETLAYEERDRHGIQFRHFSVCKSSADKEKGRSHVYVWFGPAAVEVPYAIKDQIYTVVRETRSTLFGPTPVTNDNAIGEDLDVETKRLDYLMKYKIHLDGGKVKIDPRIEFGLPLTTLSGERSPDAGLFFNTLLERVNFRYGEKTDDAKALELGLSLEQLAELPENVRLRVLMFLPDLEPLEKALCLKVERNSFLRCTTVNKGLVKVAKRISRRRRANNPEPVRSSTRRQELMSELLKMDDDTLEDLVLVYKRYQRKGSRM